MIRNESHMFINGVSGNLLGIAMSFDDEVDLGFDFGHGYAV